MTSPVRIAITPGEPAGIGPDICAQLSDIDEDVSITLFADETLLQQRAQQLGITLDEHIQIRHIPLATPASSGQLDTANAPYVLATIRAAVQACIAGECDALVTGPVHKGIMNDAGIPFTGHTEYLAELTNTPLPVMMLTVPGLRVALATTHLPLSKVSETITRERLLSVLHILHHDLQQCFAIPHPHILVCGLNPHAGENGHLGREEIDVIQPVLETLRNEGMKLTGPVAADTAFTPMNLQTADAVLAMYHDQGLPVLKHMGFGDAINVTLGLPIIRTSVDHGTALELAGSGRAHTGSLQAALKLAIELVRHKAA